MIGGMRFHMLLPLLVAQARKQPATTDAATTPEVPTAPDTAATPTTVRVTSRQIENAAAYDPFNPPRVPELEIPELDLTPWEACGPPNRNARRGGRGENPDVSRRRSRTPGR